MRRVRSDKEKVVIAALIGAFQERHDLPSREEIEAKAAALAPLLGYDGDLNDIVITAETIIPLRIKSGVSPVNVEAAHD